MNIKKILFSLLLTAGCLTASAQETEYKEVFNPHWYIQLQGGAQYTLGERSFGNLISPNIQVAGGYRFNSVLGLRLSLESWQSKGGSELESGKYKWKWNYVAPHLDLTFDLTNAIGGYNPNRVVSAGLLAGIGANIAWGNDDAATANAKMLSANSLDGNYLGYLWDGTKVRLVGRVGAYVDFKVSERVAIGLELNANTLHDAYNSKKTDNPDWYFNGLVGVKINLGKTSKKVAVEKPAPVIIEKIVEKPVEKIVEKVVEVPAEPMRRDIFFNIRGSEVSKTEMPKVEDIVTYLNKYPKAKVTITGYADKGTGNPKINKTYAEKRAQMVSDILVKKYGINSSRITVDSKGDTEQPYEINELNRVSICVAE